MAKHQALLPAALAVLAISGGLSLAPARSGAQPAAPAAPKDPAADLVVLATTEHNATVTTADLPLILTKLRRQETALVRRAVFVTGAISRTRPPPPAPDTAPETCRWAYQSFMQRQVCFGSMTGLFSCTDPEVTTLPDEADGAVELAAGHSADCSETFAAADAARDKLVETLRTRAQALFDADQHIKVDPIFKAAGVTVRPGKPPAPGVRPGR